MNSFEFNKISGAVLGTIFVLFGGSLLAEGLFHSEAPETPGYEIVAAEPEAGGGEGGAAETEEVPIAALMQTADAEAGAGQFKKCAACHSGDKGGPNKVGPVLWDVVNRPVASVPDFAYSGALQEFSQGGSVNWDYDHLNGFLADPKGYVPGTTMGFAGIKDPEARAALIAYLRTLSDNPAPLPEAPAEGAAPAETAVANPAATTQPEESTDDAQVQAPAVTDPDAAQALPGAEAAPTQAVEGDAQAPAAAPPAEAPIAAPADTAQAPAGGEATANAEAQAATPAPAASEAAPATSEQPAQPDAAGTPPAPAAEQPAPAEAPAAAPQSGAAAPAAAPEQTASVSGDPAAGEKAFRKCAACHAVGEGAKNKLGPELNGIVGEKIAAVEGYNFSSALTEYAAAHPIWTVEELTAWITDPKGMVPGTKMSFAGIKKPDEVANIIAYLATFDENGARTGN